MKIRIPPNNKKLYEGKLIFVPSAALTVSPKAGKPVAFTHEIARAPTITPHTFPIPPSTTIASKMIVNENKEFFGSVSGGCVESFIIQESLEIIKKNIFFKIKKFKISDENAWNVGLSCGGEITVYLEQIHLTERILNQIFQKKKNVILIL